MSICSAEHVFKSAMGVQIFLKLSPMVLLLDYTYDNSEAISILATGNSSSYTDTFLAF